MTEIKPVLLVSIITTTYNRRRLVRTSIDSSLAWRGHREDIEILVIDDGSTDGTFDDLQNAYAPQIAGGSLKLVRLDRNAGVTAAKNVGIEQAKGLWVTFMDSDDSFVADTDSAVLETLQAHADKALIFFRCSDSQTGQLIGQAASGPIDVDVRAYLSAWPWAECLPFIDRKLLRRFPYEPRLRGHEGLAYARILKFGAPGWLSPSIVRKYDSGGDDRVSAWPARMARAHLLASGHIATVREFHRELGLAASASLIARAAAYGLIHALMKFARADSPKSAKGVLRDAP